MHASMSLAARFLASIAAIGLLLAPQIAQAATITSVTANTSTLILTINGSGFSIGTVSVTLDSTALAVVSRTDSTVTASLPPGLSSGVHPGMLTLSSRAGVSRLAFSVSISAPPSPGGATVGALRVLDANGQFVGHFYPGRIYLPGTPIRVLSFYEFLGEIAEEALYFESTDCTGTAYYAPMGQPSTPSMTKVFLAPGGQLGIVTTCTLRTVKSNLFSSTGCLPNNTTSTFCEVNLEAFPFVAPFRVSP